MTRFGVLVCYVVMSIRAFHIGRRVRIAYAQTATFARTMRNNFELAVAIAVAVFGTNSGPAFAAVIGPRIKVPVLSSPAHGAPWFSTRAFTARGDVVSPS